MLEAIREEYPKSFLNSIAVLPSESGETPLQHYNACLATAVIQEQANAAIIFQNSLLVKLIAKHCGPVVSIHNINQYIANVLLNLLTPKSGVSFDFYSPVGMLTCMSEFKFLEAFSTPFPFEKKAVGQSHSCGAVLDGLNEQMTATDSSSAQGGAVAMKIDTLLSEGIGSEQSKQKSEGILRIKQRIINAHLMLRGELVQDEGKRAASQIRSKILARYKLVDWNPDGLTTQFYNQAPLLLPNVCNNFTIVRESRKSDYKQNNLLELAKELSNDSNLEVCSQVRVIESRAYVHQYEKYGCQEGTFRESFVKVQRIVNNYESALL